MYYAVQVDLWKKYIAWEKSNPLRSEDTALITRRVMFAFEQCLLCVGHHPDIWYEASQFLDQSSKLLIEKGVSLCNVYKAGLKTKIFEPLDSKNA